MTLSSAKKRYYWLDIERVIALFCIILNHAMNRTFRNYGGHYENFLSLGIGNNIFRSVFCILSDCGVPIFLMITGSLILGKSFETQENIRHFYKKNVKSLFITAEIWFFIDFLVQNLRDVYYNNIAYSSILSFLKDLGLTLIWINQKTFDSMWYIKAIIPIYLILPFVSLAAKKFSPRVFILYGGLIYAVKMVLPTINGIIKICGGQTVLSTSINGYILSQLLLYIFLGYWVSRGGLKDKRSGVLGIWAGACFFLAASYHFLLMGTPEETITATFLDDISLENCFLLPLAVSVFELIRRNSQALKPIEGPITELSRISFGVYLVHINIMSVLTDFLNLPVLPPWAHIYYLFFSSIILSVFFISLFSKIPFCKKYLFMIKD